MKNLLRLLALVFLAAFAHTAVAQDAPDPYNTYRWNRDGVGAADSDWYEWWYYKVVTPETDDAFYFIYGVVNPADSAETRAGSRSYVGFGSFADRQVVDPRFPTAAFAASYDVTRIQVLDNIATDRTLTGHVDDAEWSLTVTKDWTFNPTDWATGTSFSNIYWYPAQASARMTGWVNYKGRHVEMHDAPAYQDRNWGTSFPKWWTWLVSNSFTDSPGTVLVAGGGVPTIAGGIQALAMGIGLLHDGRTYAFRSADGARIEADVSFGTWQVVATNLEGYRIEISADAPREKFLDIPFHTPDGGVFHDMEALRGHIHVRLLGYNLLGMDWREIADLTTELGGIEYGSAEAP